MGTNSEDTYSADISSADAAEPGYSEPLCRGRGRRSVRNLQGTASVETFLLTAIATILITRGYLDLTNYPQVGGGTLHIAHALYGGAAMVIALVMNWMFLGHRMFRMATILGGIGLGLFLDEVGKFVTADNDYFYGPAAEIMFLTIVALLLLSRSLRALRPPTPHEYLCNAATIATRGLAHGLKAQDRALALEMLARSDGGVSPTRRAAVKGLVDAAPHTASRQWALPRAVRGVVARIVSPSWVPALVGWVLTLSALAGVAIGIAQIVLGGTELDGSSTDITVDRMGPASVVLFISAALTLVIAAPAALCLRRSDSLWPLLALRVAALISTVLHALANFATEGFAAVGGIAVGGAALAALSHHIRVRVMIAPDSGDGKSRFESYLVDGRAL